MKTIYDFVLYVDIINIAVQDTSAFLDEERQKVLDAFPGSRVVALYSDHSSLVMLGSSL